MADADVVRIKKYPNRRYYDASRSRHITLEEVYELVQSGREVQITDSRSGADLTNQVLLQILLDRDNVKLDLVPSTFLHLMIRTNQQALRDSFERVYGPMLDMFTASQKQFDGFLRQTTGASGASPFDWASRMAEAFSSGVSPGGAGDTAPPDADPPPPDPEPDAHSDAIDDLRRQMDALTRQMQNLSKKRKSSGS